MDARDHDEGSGPGARLLPEGGRGLARRVPTPGSDMLTEGQSRSERRLWRKGAHNHLWLIGMLSGVFLASFLLPLLGGTDLRICPFYLITGYPCPGCGMGRSFCALSRGDLVQAFRAHMLGPLFYLFLLGVLFQHIVEYLRARRCRWPASLRRWSRPLSVFAMVATLLAWLVRLAGFWPLP